MTEQEKEDLRCNILILVTTRSEREALETAANEAGLEFKRHRLPRIERYYNLGTIGNIKVNAAPTEMGPLGHQGSAAKAMMLAEQAMDLRLATSATGIIQLGMAFGVDRVSQRVGDVLVSTSLIPYDNRDVVAQSVETVVMPPDEHGMVAGAMMVGGQAVRPPEPAELAAGVVNAPLPRELDEGLPYRTDYSRAKRYYAKQSLLEMFERERDRGGYAHGIHFGGLLSGAARIFSRRFLRELVNGVPQAEDGIIGGDMEGVGLLGVSPPNDPLWIVVKAISDFADEKRGNVHQNEDQAVAYEQDRFNACRNSARFVLRALANAEVQ